MNPQQQFCRRILFAGSALVVLLAVSAAGLRSRANANDEVPASGPAPPANDLEQARQEEAQARSDSHDAYDAHKQAEKAANDAAERAADAEKQAEDAEHAAQGGGNWVRTAKAARAKADRLKDEAEQAEKDRLEAEKRLQDAYKTLTDAEQRRINLQYASANAAPGQSSGGFGTQSSGGFGTPSSGGFGSPFGPGNASGPINSNYPFPVGPTFPPSGTPGGASGFGSAFGGAFSFTGGGDVSFLPGAIGAETDIVPDRPEWHTAAANALEAYNSLADNLTVFIDGVTVPAGDDQYTLNLQALQQADVGNPNSALNQQIQNVQNQIDAMDEVFYAGDEAWRSRNFNDFMDLGADLLTGLQTIKLIVGDLAAHPDEVRKDQQRQAAFWADWEKRRAARIQQMYDEMPTWARASGAVWGATKAAGDMFIVEPLMQVGDLAGNMNEVLIWVPIWYATGYDRPHEQRWHMVVAGTRREVNDFSEWTGFRELTGFQVAQGRSLSATGQLAEGGYKHLGSAFVSGITDAPGRVYDAAMSGDPVAFGGSAFQLYAAGKTVAGPATFGGNLAIHGLHRLGTRLGGSIGGRLISVHSGVRSLQVKWLKFTTSLRQRVASRIYGPQRAQPWNAREVQWGYEYVYRDVMGRPEWHTRGAYNPWDGVRLYESAFVPPPFAAGNVLQSLRPTNWGNWGTVLDNVANTPLTEWEKMAAIARGMDARHFAYHEGFHSMQFWYYPKWFDMRFPFYRANPQEFTLPASWGFHQPMPGAWNASIANAPAAAGRVSTYLAPSMIHVGGFAPLDVNILPVGSGLHSGASAGRTTISGIDVPSIDPGGIFGGGTEFTGSGGSSAPFPSFPLGSSGTGGGFGFGDTLFGGGSTPVEPTQPGGGFSGGAAQSSAASGQRRGISDEIAGGIAEVDTGSGTPFFADPDAEVLAEGEQSGGPDAAAAGGPSQSGSASTIEPEEIPQAREAVDQARNNYAQAIWAEIQARNAYGNDDWRVQRAEDRTKVAALDYLAAQAKLDSAMARENYSFEPTDSVKSRRDDASRRAAEARQKADEARAEYDAKWIIDSGVDEVFIDGGGLQIPDSPGDGGAEPFGSMGQFDSSSSFLGRFGGGFNPDLALFGVGFGSGLGLADTGFGGGSTPVEPTQPGGGFAPGQGAASGAGTGTGGSTGAGDSGTPAAGAGTQASSGSSSPPEPQWLAESRERARNAREAEKQAHDNYAQAIMDSSQKERRARESEKRARESGRIADREAAEADRKAANQASDWTDVRRHQFRAAQAGSEYAEEMFVFANYDASGEFEHWQLDNFSAKTSQAAAKANAAEQKAEQSLAQYHSRWSRWQTSGIDEVLMGGGGPQFNLPGLVTPEEQSAQPPVGGPPTTPQSGFGAQSGVMELGSGEFPGYSEIEHAVRSYIVQSGILESGGGGDFGAEVRADSGQQAQPPSGLRIWDAEAAAAAEPFWLPGYGGPLGMLMTFWQYERYYMPETRQRLAEGFDPSNPARAGSGAYNLQASQRQPRAVRDADVWLPAQTPEAPATQTPGAPDTPGFSVWGRLPGLGDGAWLSKLPGLTPPEEQSAEPDDDAAPLDPAMPGTGGGGTEEVIVYAPSPLPVGFGVSVGGNSDFPFGVGFGSGFGFAGTGFGGPSTPVEPAQPGGGFARGQGTEVAGGAGGNTGAGVAGNPVAGSGQQGSSGANAPAEPDHVRQARADVEQAHTNYAQAISAENNERETYGDEHWRVERASNWTKVAKDEYDLAQADLNLAEKESEFLRASAEYFRIKSEDFGFLAATAGGLLGPLEEQWNAEVTIAGAKYDKAIFARDEAASQAAAARQKAEQSRAEYDANWRIGSGIEQVIIGGGGPLADFPQGSGATPGYSVWDTNSFAWPDAGGVPSSLPGVATGGEQTVEPAGAVSMPLGPTGTPLTPQQREHVADMLLIYLTRSIPSRKPATADSKSASAGSVQQDVANLVQALNSAGFDDVRIEERDGKYVVVLQSEPLDSRPSGRSPGVVEQWGLYRIGLVPQLHAPLLDVIRPLGETPADERILFHLDVWLDRTAPQAKRLDLDTLLKDLVEEPDIPAGERAVLAGRIRDSQNAVRSTRERALPAHRAAELQAFAKPQTDDPLVIAVIDSGVDLAHPELWGQLWRNPGEVPGNGRDDDQNGFVDDVFGFNFDSDTADLQDDNGHGTFVAGIIAARHDGRGMAGINPHARLMVLKAAGADGKMTPLALCRAIHYAVKHGAKIIHMSLGVSPPGDLVTATIEWARRQGVLLVAPSGSDGGDTGEMAPGCLPGVLTVGATTPRDERAPLSGWGNHLDLVAPGVDVLSLRAAGTDFLKSFAGREELAAGDAIVADRWYRAGGTSFAAPFATGVASLLWTREPDISAEQLQHMLLMSCEDLDRPGWDVETGCGLLNADRALEVDPDRFVHTRITAVAAGRHEGLAAIEVRGRAEGHDLRERRLELAFGEEPSASVWTPITAATDSIPDGLLGYVPGSRLNRAGVWTIRSVVKDVSGTQRQALVKVRIE